MIGPNPGSRPSQGPTLYKGRARPTLSRTPRGLLGIQAAAEPLPAPPFPRRPSRALHCGSALGIGSNRCRRVAPNKDLTSWKMSTRPGASFYGWCSLLREVTARRNDQSAHLFRVHWNGQESHSVRRWMMNSPA